MVVNLERFCNIVTTVKPNELVIGDVQRQKHIADFL